MDLRSGEVRTCSNTLSAAFSQSPLQVTQVSSLSQPGAQDEVKATPGTPTPTHVSLITTATQTFLSSPLSLSAEASEYSSEVTPLDKSMWESLSPSASPSSTTSTGRSLLSTSGYINTTYFEEGTQATKQLLDSPSQLNAPAASKAGVLIELDTLDGRASASSLQFTSGSSDDSSLTRSTSTLLAKSDTCICPEVADSGTTVDSENKENVDPDENKENIDPNAIRPSCSGVTLNPEVPELPLKQTQKHTTLQVAEVDAERRNPISSSVASEAVPLPDLQPDSSTSPASRVVKEEEDAQVPDSDIESYHTCEDDASDREEDTPTREKPLGEP